MYKSFHTFGIIAPAGKLSREKFDSGVDWLRSEGKTVKLSEHVNAPYPVEYLSSSAEERAKDLTALWLDSEVDLLLATRGGFGSAHLLPLLDWNALKSRPNLPLAGFSDITALHWTMEKLGIGRPIAGPMLGKLAESSQCAYTTRYNDLAFESSSYTIEAAPEYGDFLPLKPGKAAGLPLVGNLSVAVTLCGTPYMPDVAGRILILEDLNEPIYKLDRYLTTLEQNGVFARCAGVLFGQFTDCATNQKLIALLQRFANGVNGPVIANFPFGHTREICTVDFHREMSVENLNISVR
ncbi:MAG: LD-carboxypeptidase [Victivallales bacterium]|jgi:muramoyltetrapeptide carboxypeptidase|nr:LD-carboxypeptidase [Victivallales bacterium]